MLAKVLFDSLCMMCFCRAFAFQNTETPRPDFDTLTSADCHYWSANRKKRNRNPFLWALLGLLLTPLITILILLCVGEAYPKENFKIER